MKIHFLINLKYSLDWNPWGCQIKWSLRNTVSTGWGDGPSPEPIWSYCNTVSCGGGGDRTLFLSPNDSTASLYPYTGWRADPSPEPKKVSNKAHKRNYYYYYYYFVWFLGCFRTFKLVQWRCKKSFILVK